VPWPSERSIEYLNGAERLARCVEQDESWALSWTLSVLNFVHIVEDDRRDITLGVATRSIRCRSTGLIPPTFSLSSMRFVQSGPAGGCGRLTLCAACT